MMFWVSGKLVVGGNIGSPKVLRVCTELAFVANYGASLLLWQVRGDLGEALAVAQTADFYWHHWRTALYFQAPPPAGGLTLCLVWFCTISPGALGMS